MKVTIAILVCCLAITFAEKPKPEIIDRYLSACRKELKYPPSQSGDPSPEQQKCFLACMFKKQGIMKADGSLDIESTINQQDADVDKVQLRKDIVERLAECTKKDKDDVCALAKCLSDGKLHNNFTGF